MADGSRHSIYAVAEASYGVTPNSPALDTIRITGTTLGLSKDPLQSEEIRDDRQIADFRLGADQVAGDINFELSYGSFDNFLKAVLLSDAWAADTPVIGTQQIKAGKTRESFTLIRYFGDIAGVDKPYYIYTGCEFTSLQLRIGANAMITGTLGVIGKGQQIVEDLTSLGTPTFNPPSTTTPLDSFTGTLQEGGSTIGVVTEVTLNMQNGLDPRYVVGSKQTLRPSVGRSNLTGQLTVFFENSSMVEKFINETRSSVQMNLPDPAGNNLKMIVPNIAYTGGQPDVAGEGPITLAMPFQALLSPTDATNFIFERTPI